MVASAMMGYYIVANYKKEERILRQLMDALTFMECELQCRLTSLPELFRKAAEHVKNPVKTLLLDIAQEMDCQIIPDAKCCMNAAIQKHSEIPDKIMPILDAICSCLGEFDLEGQIVGFQSARQQAQNQLDGLTNNKERRLRSYQTLALCAGAAMVILLL